MPTKAPKAPKAQGDKAVGRPTQDVRNPMHFKALAALDELAPWSAPSPCRAGRS